MRFLAKVLNLECRVRRGPYQRSISSNAWVGNEGEVDAVIFVRAGFQQSNLAAATLCAGQYSCSNIQDRRSHCRPRRIALARVLLTAQRSTHCNEAICREPESEAGENSCRHFFQAACIARRDWKQNELDLAYLPRVCRTAQPYRPGSHPA